MENPNSPAPRVMDTRQGYIKLPRELLAAPMARQPQRLALFVHLLLMAILVFSFVAYQVQPNEIGAHVTALLALLLMARSRMLMVEFGKSNSSGLDQISPSSPNVNTPDPFSLSVWSD